MEKSNSTPKAVSLYPNHIEIIEQFAARTGRTFSNAVQWIVSTWAEEHRELWNGQPASESTMPEPSA
jgi:hypothetical protein